MAPGTIPALRTDSGAPPRPRIRARRQPPSDRSRASRDVHRTERCNDGDRHEAIAGALATRTGLNRRGVPARRDLAEFDRRRLQRSDRSLPPSPRRPAMRSLTRADTASQSHRPEWPLLHCRARREPCPRATVPAADAPSARRRRHVRTRVTCPCRRRPRGWRRSATHRLRSSGP